MDIACGHGKGEQVLNVRLDGDYSTSSLMAPYKFRTIEISVRNVSYKVKPGRGIF